MNPTDLPLLGRNTDSQRKIGSLQERFDVSSAISSPINLIQEFNNFRSSKNPSRFLYFENGSWFNFAHEVFDKLRDGFVHGKSALEISVDGNLYIFDFLRMIKVHVQTGVTNSIAWIDVTGKCFFPRVVLDESVRPKPDVEVSGEDDTDSSSNSNSRKRKRGTGNNSFEECTDESPDVTSGTVSSHSYDSFQYINLQCPSWKNVQKIGKEDRFFKLLEKLFVTGMARSPGGPTPMTITAVHKCLLVGPTGSLRLKAFQLRAQEMKMLRGEKCATFGWYSASLKDLELVLQFGFGTMNNELLGSRAHGMGVHLAAPHYSFKSAMMAEEDENGERHVILCRVVIGRPELVEAGSTRSHPSSGAYDSAVDNLINPKWYVVWGTHMNTHILPEYLVSFKISKHDERLLRTDVEGVKKPCVAKNASNLQFHFPKLISELKQSLAPNCIEALRHSYNRWQEGKLSKDAFIKFMRTLAGDKLLVTIIRKIRGY